MSTSALAPEIAYLGVKQNKGGLSTADEVVNYLSTLEEFSTSLRPDLRTSDKNGFKLVSRRALKAALGQNFGKSKFFTLLILIEIIFRIVFSGYMICRRK